MGNAHENVAWLYDPNAKPAKELSEHDQAMIKLGWDAALSHHKLPRLSKGIDEREEIDILASGIALVLLAEWIAIEHNETRLQASKYMDEAQSLADWLDVIGY